MAPPVESSITSQKCPAFCSTSSSGSRGVAPIQTLYGAKSPFGEDGGSQVKDTDISVEPITLNEVILRSLTEEGAGERVSKLHS